MESLLKPKTAANKRTPLSHNNLGFDPKSANNERESNENKFLGVKMKPQIIKNTNSEVPYSFLEVEIS